MIWYYKHSNNKNNSKSQWIKCHLTDNKERLSITYSHRILGIRLERAWGSYLFQPPVQNRVGRPTGPGFSRTICMYGHGAVLFCLMSQEKYHLDRLCFFSWSHGSYNTYAQQYMHGLQIWIWQVLCVCVYACVCVKVAVQLPNEIHKEVHSACSVYVIWSFSMKNNRIQSS